MTVPSDGIIKSQPVNPLGRNDTGNAQKREKGGRVLTHPKQPTSVLLPPLAETLTVAPSGSRGYRLSSSGRQRVQIETSDTHETAIIGNTTTRGVGA